MKSKMRNAKARKLIRPTAAEDRQINAGIAADPDTRELTAADFKKMQPLPEVLLARMNAGLTQAKFAALLGISVRTLQGWEQGQRKPALASRALITIAQKRPDVLRELFSE